MNKLLSLEEAESLYKKHSLVGLDPVRTAIYKQFADTMRENERLKKENDYLSEILLSYDKQHKDTDNG